LRTREQSGVELVRRHTLPQTRSSDRMHLGCTSAGVPELRSAGAAGGAVPRPHPEQARSWLRSGAVATLAAVCACSAHTRRLQLMPLSLSWLAGRHVAPQALAYGDPLRTLAARRYAAATGESPIAAVAARAGGTGGTLLGCAVVCAPSPVPRTSGRHNHIVGAWRRPCAAPASVGGHVESAVAGRPGRQRHGNGAPGCDSDGAHHPRGMGTTRARSRASRGAGEPESGCRRTHPTSQLSLFDAAPASATPHTAPVAAALPAGAVVIVDAGAELSVHAAKDGDVLSPPTVTNPPLAANPPLTANPAPAADPAPGAVALGEATAVTGSVEPSGSPTHLAADAAAGASDSSQRSALGLAGSQVVPTPPVPERAAGRREADATAPVPPAGDEEQRSETTPKRTRALTAGAACTGWRRVGRLPADARAPQVGRTLAGCSVAPGTTEWGHDARSAHSLDGAPLTASCLGPTTARDSPSRRGARDLQPPARGGRVEASLPCLPNTPRNSTSGERPPT